MFEAFRTSVTNYHMQTDEGIIPWILPAERSSIMHGFFPPPPNTHRRQFSRMGSVQWGRKSISSLHRTSHQVNIDYTFLVPLAIISDMNSPLVSMGIAELGRKTSSNYKHWILIPNSSILGKWLQVSTLRMTQKAEADWNPDCCRGCQGTGTLGSQVNYW